MTNATVESIQKYRVGDKEFASIDEANAYAAKLRHAERIEAYIGSREWPRGRDTLARNVIAGFLAYEDTLAEVDFGAEGTDDFAG